MTRNPNYDSGSNKRSNYKKMNDATRTITNKAAMITRNLDHLRKADEGKIILNDPEQEVNDIIANAHEIFEELSKIITCANEEKWRM